MSGADIPSKRKKMDNEDGLSRETSPDFFHLLRTMLKDKECTDVTIKVGSGIKSKEIECHLLILKAHSPVLRAMLSSRWNEGGNQGNERILTLEDDDPEHFECFVNMMYRDWKEEDREEYYDDYLPDVGLNVETAIGVLSMAHKYLASHVILQLEHWFFCYLCQNGTYDDDVELYIKLKSLPICQVEDRARSLLRTVENCVLAEAEVIFSTDTILKFNHSDLMHIVKQSHLQCSEELVYKGCITWGNQQCKLNECHSTGEKLRHFLGEIMKYIRFPLLDNLTIAKTVRKAKVLTPDELNDLFAYIIQKDVLLKVECPIWCSSEPRIGKEFWIVNRLDENFETYEPTILADFSAVHGFVLKMSEQVKLCGLEFYGAPSTSKNYNYQIKINGEPFCKKVKTFSKEKRKGKIVSVDIVPNIVIHAKTSVEIEFTITGGSTYICPHSVQEVTKEHTFCHQEMTTVISTFRLSSKRNVSNGLRQIPTLIFLPC